MQIVLVLFKDMNFLLSPWYNGGEWNLHGFCWISGPAHIIQAHSTVSASGKASLWGCITALQAQMQPHGCSLDAHYVLVTAQHTLAYHFDFWDFEGGDGIESGWCFCSFDCSFWILPWPLISCLVWSLTQLKTEQQLSWGHHVSTSKFSTKLTSFRGTDLRLLKWCWK